MTLNEVLIVLEAAGTAQNRKVYARHGVKEPMFGVSYAVQGKLAKKIKQDHDVAVGLWQSGIHDARILATCVADAEALSSAELDAWVRDLDNYVLTDALAKLAARRKDAVKLAEKHLKTSGEWSASFGWTILTVAAMEDATIDDKYFLEKIAAIEKGIHGAKNRVRHTMNMALISFGIRNAALNKAAVAAAKHIGKVEVDHGETGCKTPDVVEYINKTMARKSGAGKKSAVAASKKTVAKGVKKAVKKTKKRAKASR